MGLSHSPTIVTDGLVLCLDAANSRSYPKSGTTWSDLAGANNGTLVNMDASNFDESNGGSLVFDGTNEYIDTDYEPVFTGDFHISCNVKFNAYISYQNIISSTDGGNANNGFWLEFGSARGFTIGNNNSSLILTDNIVNLQSLSTNTHYNIRVNRSGSDITLHVNNILCGSGSFSGTVGKVGRNLLISKYSQANFARMFSGKIYNLHIYNRALSADEVRRNYLATKGRYE